MSREMLMLVDALAREKNVDREVVFEALEQALASATKKRFKEDADVRVSIDRSTGDYESFRRWQVVSETELESEDYQILLVDARDSHPDIELGDYIEEPLENIEFGRIGAQAAKQVILQKIRDAEREQIISDFLARKEHLVTGVVKRVDRGNAIIESGRVEGFRSCSSSKSRKSRKACWKSRPPRVIPACAPRSPWSRTTRASIRSAPASACAARASPR